MRISDAIADLLIGSQCLGCRRPQWGICPECRQALTATPTVRTVGSVTGLGEVTVFSACSYAPPIPNLITAWKDHGSWSLSSALVEAVATVVPLGLTFDLVVPVPSAAAAVRDRGFDHSAALASGLARIHRAPAIKVLRRRRGGRDQAGLGRSDRWANQRSRLLARTTTGSRRRVLLVDDVVTTGATLTAATDALTVAGWRVSAVVTVASTDRAVPLSKEGSN